MLVCMYSIHVYHMSVICGWMFWCEPTVSAVAVLTGVGPVDAAALAPHTQVITHNTIAPPTIKQDITTRIAPVITIDGLHGGTDNDILELHKGNQTFRCFSTKTNTYRLSVEFNIFKKGHVPFSYNLKILAVG